MNNTWGQKIWWLNRGSGDGREVEIGGMEKIKVSINVGGHTHLSKVLQGTVQCCTLLDGKP